MIYANQFEYDNAEPDLYDYQEDLLFAEFAEYVTLELLNGRDWQNLSSQMLMIDLECLEGGYQTALEWVCGRVTEQQYVEFTNDEIIKLVGI